MWLITLTFFYVAAVVSYLVRRKLAQSSQDQNMFINLVFFLCFIVPTGLVLGTFLPHAAIGWPLFAALFFGSLVWPIQNLVSFKANEHLDLGVFTVLGNIGPIVTILIALTLLNEQVSQLNALGMVLLIAAGLTTTYPVLKRAHRASLFGIFVAVAAAVITGLGIAFEKYMLSNMHIGTYLWLGWGSQAIWMLLLNANKLTKLRSYFHENKQRINSIYLYGLSKAFQGALFVSTLVLSGSAARVGAAVNFLSVIIVIAAYFFLRERGDMLYKYAGAGLGIIGLFLVAA